MSYKQAQDAYGIQGKYTVINWLHKHGNQDWSLNTLYDTKTKRYCQLDKILMLSFLNFVSFISIQSPLERRF